MECINFEASQKKSYINMILRKNEEIKWNNEVLYEKRQNTTKKKSYFKCESNWNQSHKIELVEAINFYLFLCSLILIIHTYPYWAMHAFINWKTVNMPLKFRPSSFNRNRIQAHRQTQTNKWIYGSGDGCLIAGFLYILFIFLKGKVITEQRTAL